MANQTITVDANHDSLTGRLAGEDITINNGAKLTIDSMPHLTAMGILGDITINDGELHIDGTRTFEVAYSNGVGSLPAVGNSITWDSGVGKIIRLNSGNNVSGVITVTKNVGVADPSGSVDFGLGSWTADIDTAVVGFLIIYGEDQDYGGVDARTTIRITGDWYQIGVGTGVDSQAVTLPHTGHQHGVWVETGNGTNVFEIWHRISSGASTVFYDSFAEFGTHFEGGKVFQQAFGSSTLTFGTSTNGGVVPSGARIRIPNVHMGTTSTAAPTTEVNSTTFTAHVAIIPPAITCNVYIDHLNASSVAVNFSQTNGAEISDSAIGLAGTFIDRCALPVSITNCCYCHSSVNTVGGVAASMIYIILDMLNGVTITDSVFYGGIDTTAAQALWIQTSQNITFEGTNKIALSITDENTSYPLRLTTSSGITNNGTLICLGGGIIATAASNNIDLGTYKYGYPTGRGTTEQNQSAIVATGINNWIIRSFGVGNGCKVPTLGLFAFTDSTNVIIRDAGSPSSKIDLGARATYVITLVGICANFKLQRLYFTNLNGAEAFIGLNSCKNILIENCSTDYNDEMEADCNDMIVRGVHVASGVVDTSTGFEGDMPNVVGTCFYDHFKSNTTGAIGLLFNDPGLVHDLDVEIVSGTPVWNGLADLLMRTSGDQVIYIWPWPIRGHTAFQNASIQTAGVNTTTNHSFEYSINTGSGWSDWADATGANLSSETIDPAGFQLRVRITTTTTSSTNALKGFAILTDTTLTDQSDNYYPFETVVVKITVKDINSGDPIEGARVFLETSPGSVNIFNELTDINGVVQNIEYAYTSSQNVIGRARKASSSPLYKTAPISATITDTGLDLTVFLIPDE